MTATATTAASAEPVQPQEPGVTRQEPEPGTSAPAQDTATRVGETNPQAGEADLQARIEKEEKRLHDKQAYLEKLQSELSNYDRNITENKQKIKQLAAYQQPTQPEHAPEAPAGTANGLGIKGDQFIEQLRENPDQALANLVGIIKAQTEADILNKLPTQLERTRIEQETRSKLQQIHQELGPEEFDLFRHRVSQYQQQGFTPTPDQVVNELRYGSPEQQRQLMEFALLTLQQRQNGQQATPEQPPQTPAAAPKRPVFPMAPGAGSPLQISQTKRSNSTAIPIPDWVNR